MFEDKVVRKKIEEAINNGASRFAIFPFGANGVSVRNCLRDCFGMEADMMIDNHYSKYNKRIVDMQYFKKNYSEDIYVLFTIEDRYVNQNLEKELLEFVPQNRIVNFLDTVNKWYEPEWNVESRFAINNILPLSIEETNIWENRFKAEKGKIKVRILHGSLIMWNALKTICDEFEKDDKFDVLVILGAAHSPETEAQMKRENHRYIKYQEYSGELDKPDIMIVALACDRYPYDLGRHARLVIAASMTLIQYAYSIDQFWKDQVEKGLNIHNPDYYLFDSMLYKELINGGYQSEKIIEMGNAKYDGIYIACQEKRYRTGWEKLKGKKVFLWATDHGISNGKIPKDLTFDLYAKTILEYANENNETGFVLRPHKALITELLENKYWSLGDYERLKRYCILSSNVVFDDTDCYDDAFSIADAVITDAYCGITCTALPTLKPICLLYRTKECIPYHPELAENYYSAHNKNELVSFLKMIQNNQDDMLELRKIASKKFVKHFDGKNGMRIKNFIEDKYNEII